MRRVSYRVVLKIEGERQCLAPCLGCGRRLVMVRGVKCPRKKADLGVSWLFTPWPVPVRQKYSFLMEHLTIPMSQGFLDCILKNSLLQMRRKPAQVNGNVTSFRLPCWWAPWWAPWWAELAPLGQGGRAARSKHLRVLLLFGFHLYMKNNGIWGTFCVPNDLFLMLHPFLRGWVILIYCFRKRKQGN